MNLLCFIAKQAPILALAILFMLSAAAIGEGLLPSIPEAQEKYSPEEGCVEPVDEMRRNHMNYILHQRDETMHEGIRDKQHSLVECINCHVAPATGGEVTRVESDEHFCNSCHSYAAVSIDCFQCHTDQPTTTSRNSFNIDSESMQAISKRVTPVHERNLLSLFAAEGSHQ